MAPGGIHQDTEAGEVIEAKVPLMIVQFQQDSVCNPQLYPNWYGRIWSAVQARRAEPSFFFLNLPGDHNDCEKLATLSRWVDYSTELHVVWESFWTAVTGD